MMLIWEFLKRFRCAIVSFKNQFLKVFVKFLKKIFEQYNDVSENQPFLQKFYINKIDLRLYCEQLFSLDFI